MKKIRLGRTNLYVNRLGWGGIPIQRVNEQAAISVVKAVIDMGVELLDTARGYTDSEYKLGLALQTIDQSVILSSKSQLRTEKIEDDVRKSLNQMKVSRIHIYHLHAVNRFEDYDQVMGPGGAYEGLQRMRDRGLIGHIGISSHSLKVLERAIEENHFDVIMACYSFLEPEADQKVFPLARAKEIGIIAMKPFSGGVIEEPGPALRFVLSQPDVLPIPGSETLEKARMNWEVFSQNRGLTSADRQYIDALRREMDHQFCRRCDYCQPCPEKISIQHLMGLRSIVKRFGSNTQELDWFQTLIEKGRNCTECGECSTRCPYQLAIPELIKKNLAWYDDLMSK
ncbi:MAG: aldo/keto reductase [Deltaproteobacteria bacterium]|nr:aldo/keto reductase [Deltaproteobacteria bacterium]MBM4322337.1 aldo/keto reductase [Deltaproteobacteria bacterium]